MTKEELKAFRAVAIEGKQLLGQIKELEGRIYGPKIQQLSGMPAVHGDGGHTLDGVVSAHMQLQERYTAQLEYISRTQLRIETAIESLEPAERMIIRYRYIDGMSWEAICEAMTYSWRQTHRIHAAALRALEDK